jgi:hypothetical protein
MTIAQSQRLRKEHIQPLKELKVLTNTKNHRIHLFINWELLQTLFHQLPNSDPAPKARLKQDFHQGSTVLKPLRITANP